MTELLQNYDLMTLFIVSFLAATLLPLGSEWLLVAMLLNGTSPLPCVVVATCGNSLGGATNYVIGRGGGEWLNRKLLHIKPQRLEQARNWFNRYGSWTLLLSWLPVIGDPLCLVSGMLKTPWLRFMILVVCGKGLRYTGLMLATIEMGSL